MKTICLSWLSTWTLSHFSGYHIWPSLKATLESFWLQFWKPGVYVDWLRSLPRPYSMSQLYHIPYMAIIQSYPGKPLTWILVARCLWSIAKTFALCVCYESVVPCVTIMQGYPGKPLTSILEARGLWSLAEKFTRSVCYEFGVPHTLISAYNHMWCTPNSI